MTKQNTPTVDAPSAPDLSGLRKEIGKQLQVIAESSAKTGEAQKDIIISIMEAKETHGDSLEREQVRALVQELVATQAGLKIEFVQSSPSKSMKEKQYQEWSKRNGAYILVSELMSAAWPKGETEQKRLVKLLKENPDASITAIKKAAKKAGTKSDKVKDNTITKKNIAEKLAAFVTKAATDRNESVEEILDEIEHELLTVVREALTKEEEEEEKNGK